MGQITTAYDLDGTLCYTDFTEGVSPLNIVHKNQRNATLLYKPEGQIIIITARPVSDYNSTYYWLNKHNIDAIVYFSPIVNFELGYMINYKLKLLKELKIELYYEDIPEIIYALQQYGINAVKPPWIK